MSDLPHCLKPPLHAPQRTSPKLTVVALRRLLLGVLLCLCALGVQALTLRAESVSAEGLRLDRLQATKDSSAWTVEIKSARTAELALAANAIRWQCQWQETACQGPISAPGFAAGTLRADWSAAELELAWKGGRLQLLFSNPQDWQLKARHLPLPRLLARLQQSWGALSSLSGSLNLDLHLLPEAVQGQWQLHELGFDQSDGTVAGAGLAAEGDLNYVLSADTLALHSRISAGELLFGPIYRQLDQPIELALEADLSTLALRVPKLDLSEGSHLQLRAALAFTDLGDLEHLRLSRLALHWPQAHPWTGPVLATAGFEGLALAGNAEISGVWQPGGWQQGQLQIDQLSVTDPEQRLQAQGVQLQAQLGEAPSLSELRWQSLGVFGIPLGPGTFSWHWQPDLLKQQGTLTVSALGGELRLRDLSRQKARWQGSVAVEGLDFAELSEHFGWPAFGGKVSADIRDFTFAEGQLKIPSEIAVAAFSGRIGVQNLSAERLFGDAPALSADIRMNDLNLQALTQAMSFGEIEGTLDGYINGLRLLNWAPLAFDARFQSKRQEGRKQKISRRAVQGLSNIGGGNLNNALVNLVDSFSYAELGIACRLKEDVCQMDGVDSDGSGYTIVRGSGLPRLTVRGYQRRVNWPVMLRRLQAAASGTGPIIE